MKHKMPTKPLRMCADCVHEFACQMWNIGNLHNTDATNCINYETVKDTAAYLIGKLESKKRGHWQEPAGTLLPAHPYEDERQWGNGTCSVCGITVDMLGAYNGFCYCPFCGAKMEVEDNA